MLIALHRFTGAVHVHPRAAVQRDDMRAALFHELGGAFGVDAHHGAEGRPVEGHVVRHRADDARRAGFPGGVDAEAQLLQRGLRLDDDGVGAGIDQGLGLLGEGVAHLLLGEVAEGFHEPAERADVADDVAVAADGAKRLAGNLDRGAVDGDDVVGVAVAVEHDPAAAERVG